MGPRAPTLHALVVALLVVGPWMALPAPAAGQTAAEAPADEVARLRQEIEQLRADYEARLAALEARLAELEAAQQSAQPLTPEDDLAALAAAAREAAGLPAGATGEPATAEPSGPVSGHERNLNRLNPEVSVTGNVRGLAGGGERDEFELQEFELDLQAALDPYSRMHLTLATEGEGEVDVEEGYLAYTALPGGLGLTIGKFRQRFGTLNRYHLHALPQSEYPLVLSTFFGEEALAQTGLSLTWLLPHPWASANELTVEVTDGQNPAFGGDSFDDLAALAHLKSYWDLSPASYFEVGLSGIAGDNGAGGDSRVWGTDLTFHWQPPSRAKYRELTWRTELLLSQRDDPATGRRHEAWGGYSYLEGLVARNLYLGVRGDWVEEPLAPEERRWGLVPYVTWWQSEYVRLRGELQHLEDEAAGDSSERFVLQLTWAAGPHKHETY
jgi:hypothetical protein